MVWYLDTSAFIKLFVAEDESAAMRAWFLGNGPCWSSYLLRTESLRTALRLGVDEAMVAETLDTVSLILPGPSTFLTAGRLQPRSLPSLDALHLATALELGADLQAVVTYDDRMIAGASAESVAVVSPPA